MASEIPPPQTQSLLPPLLACLPTSFASVRPPPALLPLLTPILRQRVQLLHDTASSPSDSWLAKLSWDSRKAEQLFSVVEQEAFEPHPISNEIEYNDVQNVGYRRLDEETLHSRIEIKDLGLVVIYLWCTGDEAGGGDGWRVAEVLPLDVRADPSPLWSQSIEEAHGKSQSYNIHNATAKGIRNAAYPIASNGASSPATNGAEDDDYWAQYDNAPSSTPGPQPSSGPAEKGRMSRHGRTASEAEYFSRYAEVQPDMENDDPSTDRNAIGKSTLHGDIVASASQTALASSLLPPATHNHPGPNDKVPPSVLSQTATKHPRPQSALSHNSSSSAVIEELKRSASMQSQTELAIRQHIASTMKNLHRLARSTGIETSEFEGLIKRDLEMLKFEEGIESS
ncbi:MAG: hypothetical protein L6R35_006528 [Caloplaca aegaea]|nr:MAG: hypothetical protein L6R35_006528 [Caloplaca aegaea]